MGNKPIKLLGPYLNAYGELLISKHKLLDYLNLVYVNSNQQNNDLA